MLIYFLVYLLLVEYLLKICQGYQPKKKVGNPFFY